MSVGTHTRPWKARYRNSPPLWTPEHRSVTVTANCPPSWAVREGETRGERHLTFLVRLRRGATSDPNLGERFADEKPTPRKVDAIRV